MRALFALCFSQAFLVNVQVFLSSSNNSVCAFNPSTHRQNFLRKNVLQSRHLFSSIDESQEVPESTAIQKKKTELEIVLFGVGDLRVSDHGGLHSAFNSLQKTKVSEDTETKILPLLILSTEDTLVNLPGLSSYTLNMATMLTTAISSLSKELKSQFDLDLEIHSGDNVEKTLFQIVEEIKADEESNISSIKINVCDLGEADNQMGYSPYTHIKKMEFGNDEIDILPWSCYLRNDPWNAVKSLTPFPDTYPEYSKLYCESDLSVLPALSSMKAIEEAQFKRQGSITSHPTLENMLSLFEKVLDPKVDTKLLNQSKNTGLYGTHWGGLDDSICSEAETLECLNQYTQICKCDDDKFLASNYYQEKIVKNDASLEHASISWMSTPKEEESESDISGKNLIKGEMMVRFLAAPLLLGCVSKRQIYHAGKNALVEEEGLFADIKSSILGEKMSVLEQFVESKEWQELFAAKNILKEEVDAGPGSLKNQYWRWHGFLCRYSVSQLLPPKASTIASSIVLVHGFGASSNQWTRAVNELAVQGASDPSFGMALAPDLIGFGQCEKPALSYTQYLWESYISTFVKEIAVQKYKTEKFVIGGNSIGGYTTMSAAADDTLVDIEGKVSSSGAPGTGRCDGLILMNSAGMILDSNDVVKKKKQEVKEGTGPLSIAEKTSGNLLEPCSPPQRDIGTIWGNILLSYLRPRIETITGPLYPSNPSNADENLCGTIRRDSLDPGAINVMISGSKLPPPRTANELLHADFGASSIATPIIEGQWKGPVLVTQGMKDPLNDATGRAFLFRALRDGIDLYPLMGAGHCPHDERPDDVVKGILEWIKKRNKSNFEIDNATKAKESSVTTVEQGA